MMAETRRYALNAQLDIDQILLEAQHRWLRPAEICEILQNYKRFRIASEPPNRPPSGSLFLFDRKVLRYFRKDGHIWRKKKDGKTVKEAHERLKAGSVDVLHCYYAHGEENENFQRRSYWMLEEELSHIVLVHYREVKGNRTTFNRIRNSGVISDSVQTVESLPNSEIDSSVASEYQPYDHQGASPVTYTTSLSGSQNTEYEDAESAYRQQSSPGFQSIPELQSPAVQKMERGSVPYNPILASNNYQGQFSGTPGMIGLVRHRENEERPMDSGLPYELDRDLEYPSWENIGGSGGTGGYNSVNVQPLLPMIQPGTTSMMLGRENELLRKVLIGAAGERQDFGGFFDGLDACQTSEVDSVNTSKWSMDKKSHQGSVYDVTSKLNDVHQMRLFGNTYLPERSRHPVQNDLQVPALNAVGSSLVSVSDGNLNLENKPNHSALKPPLLDDFLRGDLKKMDSFDRWMSKELGDVTLTRMQSDSGADWEIVRAGDGVYDSGISAPVPTENYLLGPSLSQDQLFSILDFSPNWAHAGLEIKVLITGTFLRSREEIQNYRWACMFGELQVPAEIIADGVLCCYTPPHEIGMVPFYVTCSNRLACSEVREFEFRTSVIQDIDLADVGSISSVETLLHMRFGKLLSLGPVTPQACTQSSAAETSHLCSKISALLKDDFDWEEMLYLTKQDEDSEDGIKDQLLQKPLKEKLHGWLIQKVTEGGKGPCVLDEGGQGVLHFAAALGYDWAIPPTVAAGVSVNFRDSNGWTALHWAALFGRERTVAFLIALGAAPGLLTDPTPIYPSARTPADLASSNGHKGIAGYLAESALSSHLSSLKLDMKEGDSGVKDVETVSERIATPYSVGDLPHGLSLKDSLAAMRNATQAAARIHQVYRVQSFQRKQRKESDDGEFGVSNERLSFLARKGNKVGQHEPAHAAAVRIQNKFRSWKGRNDFLLMRQRIIKIQAHVRGHQVRKNYKKIIWSVGILDKVILRWRRKGKGLSGFKPEAPTTGSSMQETESKEDEYDFLKKGRKQTEERLQKALDRVRSMVQYPEARDQYRRLLNVVSEMQETKAAHDTVMANPEVHFDNDLIDLQALLEDDILMPTIS
ncbi:calmodulin-binding transcription activator 3 isoform X2 [Henckelia pumila]|uniref:calmodulin-binding transcription activator 3 isoform X2 n=1 Tax=Henckelia pumila TaxID=405737 RepID=UPI003C6DFD90